MTESDIKSLLLEGRLNISGTHASRPDNQDFALLEEYSEFK